MSRKLPSALRRGQSTVLPTVPAQKPGPINNYYAKVSDGYVRGACNKRPERSVVEAHHKQLQTQAAEEAVAATQREEARRAAGQKRETMIARPQETMQTQRPTSNMRRVMIGATLLGMMAVPPHLQRS